MGCVGLCGENEVVVISQKEVKVYDEMKIQNQLHIKEESCNVKDNAIPVDKRVDTNTLVHVTMERPRGFVKKSKYRNKMDLPLPNAVETNSENTEFKAVDSVMSTFQVECHVDSTPKIIPSSNGDIWSFWNDCDCGCKTFQPHAFKRNICNFCFHKHNK